VVSPDTFFRNKSFHVSTQRHRSFSGLAPGEEVDGEIEGFFVGWVIRAIAFSFSSSAFAWLVIAIFLCHFFLWLKGQNVSEKKWSPVHMLAKKLETRENERPEKPSAFPLKFKAIRPQCLLRVAERRTPGCRFSTWGMCNRRRCVVTLGSEDLRVYIADHKPPTVFNLKRLQVARRGQKYLELSRSNWMTNVFQRLCCCEPLTCTVTMRLDQVGAGGLHRNSMTY